MADAPHAVLEVALPVEALDAGDRGAVAVRDVRLGVEGLGQVGAQDVGVVAEVLAEADQPGEGVGAPGLLVEELEVAAEDLVGGLAGQGDRRLVADGAEEQVQRGVHVAEAQGEIAGAEHLRADVEVGEGLCVEDDVLVVGPGGAGHVVDVGGVGVPRSSSATKFSFWPTKSTAKLRTFSPCSAS